MLVFNMCWPFVLYPLHSAKKDYICERIIDCDSSRELFRLSNQLMGTFRGTVLPSNISPESLPDKFSEFFVRKIETD